MLHAGDWVLPQVEWRDNPHRPPLFHPGANKEGTGCDISRLCWVADRRTVA